MEPKALCVQGKHSTHSATPLASIFDIFTFFFFFGVFNRSFSCVVTSDRNFCPFPSSFATHNSSLSSCYCFSFMGMGPKLLESAVWLRPPSSHLRPAPPQNCSASPLGNHCHPTLAVLQVGKLGSSTLVVSATLSLLGPKLRIFIELGQEEEKCFLKQTAFGFGIFNELFPSWFL